jgi:hypothetical protein
MTKSIQQILEEERQKSQIGKVSDHHINRALANKAKADDPTIKEKLSKSIKKSYKDNPDQIKGKLEKLKNANEKLFSDPEYRKKLKEDRQKQAKDPIYLQKLAEGIAKRDANPEYQKARALAFEKRNNNADWKENIKKAQQNRSPEHIKAAFRSKAYPIVTPDGVFEGLEKAHEAYNKIRSFNNGRKWVLSMMKKEPTKYYKISWEEFDALTRSDDNNGQSTL